MKTTFFILSIVLLCCQTKEKTLFDPFIKESDVEIYLSKLNLDTVPKEIGLLKNARRLYINSDTVNTWTIYPPLSGLAKDNSKPPFRHLPIEITGLTKLRSLTLVNLDLVTLPDDIYKLENLDSLILYMNKLTISYEVEKINKLSNLKYLGILGNNITASDLIELKKSNPELIINPNLR
jgi:Leucine-rich repeat (LRR) protein